MHNVRRRYSIIALAASIAVGVMLTVLLIRINILGYDVFYIEAALSGSMEIFFIGIPALLLMYMHTERWSKLRQSLKSPGVFYVSLSILLTVSCTVLSGLISMLWGTWLESISYPIRNLSLTAPVNLLQWMTALFTSALLPAFCEEILFRGFMLGVLSNRMSEKNAVYVSSAIFAVCHFYLEGLPALLFIGFILAKVMVKRHRLLLPIVIHASYNAVSLLISSTGWGITSQVIILCIGIFFASMYYLTGRKEYSCS